MSGTRMQLACQRNHEWIQGLGPRVSGQFRPKVVVEGPHAARLTCRRAEHAQLPNPKAQTYHIEASMRA